LLVIKKITLWRPRHDRTVKSFLQEVAQHMVTAFNIRIAVAQHTNTCNQIFNFCQNFWVGCSPAALMDKLPLNPEFHSGISEDTNCLGCDNFVTGLTNISHLHFSHLMVAKYQTQQDCAYGPISTWHDTTENLCHLSDQSDIINYDKTCQNRFIGITTQPVWNNFLIMT